jgi:hypothetical protein
MKRFYRNETLHQSDPTRGRRNRNSFHNNRLAQGMPYATLDPEGMNSLHQGGNNVLTYPSRSYRDCGCGGGSRMRRLQPIDQSSIIQGASPDPYRSLVVHHVVERHKGSRCEMGTGAFNGRAKCFGGNRSGWRHVVAARVRLFDEYSERSARGADGHNRHRQGRPARGVRDAAN